MIHSQIDANSRLERNTKVFLTKDITSPNTLLQSNGEYLLKQHEKRQHSTIDTTRSRYQNLSALKHQSRMTKVGNTAAKSTRNAGSKAAAATGKSQYFIFNDINNLAQCLDRNSKVVEPLFKSAVQPKF